MGVDRGFGFVDLAMEARDVTGGACGAFYRSTWSSGQGLAYPLYVAVHIIVAGALGSCGVPSSERGMRTIDRMMLGV